MNIDRAGGEENRETGAGTTLYKDESWYIGYSAEKKELIFRTTDYHADPLRIGVDSLLKLVQGIKTGAIDQAGPKNAGEKLSDQPADYVAMFQRAGYEVGISKKEKSLCAVPTDGKGSMIKISRKEMMVIGRAMNKRVKRTNKK